MHLATGQKLATGSTHDKMKIRKRKQESEETHTHQGKKWELQKENDDDGNGRNHENIRIPKVRVDEKKTTATSQADFRWVVSSP